MDGKPKKKCGENLSRFSGNTDWENQAQCQFLGLACEQLIQQNGLTFRIQCENERIIVRYPTSEILIKTQ